MSHLAAGLIYGAHNNWWIYGSFLDFSLACCQRNIVYIVHDLACIASSLHMPLLQQIVCCGQNGFQYICWMVFLLLYGLINSLPLVCVCVCVISGIRCIIFPSVTLHKPMPMKFLVEGCPRILFCKIDWLVLYITSISQPVLGLMSWIKAEHCGHPLWR
jgi:hypothetical protein